MPSNGCACFIFYSIGSVEERWEALLRKHVAEIVDSVIHTPRRQTTVYNFALNRAPNREEIRRQLQQIFRDQNQPFKVNLSMGFALVNRVDHELYYHYTSNNYMWLDRPNLIWSLGILNPSLKSWFLWTPWLRPTNADQKVNGWMTLLPTFVGLLRKSVAQGCLCPAIQWLFFQVGH